MNRVRFSANVDTDYVFHMPSVARWGYDNDYGARRRGAYPREDPACLKEREDMLTVAGGARIGALYAPLVMAPALAETSANRHYEDFAARAEASGGGAAARVARVMARHFDHYARRVWPEDERAIRAYIPAVLRRFEETSFTDRAERAVGCRLPGEWFTAEMVASVEDGPEGIDISAGQDVFGVAREPEHAFRFIGHEFIIYPLKRALAREDAFRSPETGPLTEGLAEHYLKRIQEGGGSFGAARQYMPFYEEMEGKGAGSAVELYRAALRLRDGRGGRGGNM